MRRFGNNSNISNLYVFPMNEDPRGWNINREHEDYIPIPEEELLKYIFIDELIRAIKYDRKEIFMELLQNGADINIVKRGVLSYTHAFMGYNNNFEKRKNIYNILVEEICQRDKMHKMC